jgi:hypothetical protein
MPRFWLHRRRSDGPTRKWNGFRPSDPDQARRQLEQARPIIERAIHLHPKAEAVIRACREDDAKTGLLGAEGRRGPRAVSKAARGAAALGSSLVAG